MTRLDNLSFEQHHLYSTLKLLAFSKSGISLAALFQFVQQENKSNATSSQVSHFPLKFNSAQDLQKAIEPFVQAGWVILREVDSEANYRITKLEIATCCTTGKIVARDDINGTVVDALVQLYLKTSDKEFTKYHSFQLFVGLLHCLDKMFVQL